MVEIIGLGTMGALVWLLAWAMGTESDAEHRRIAMLGEGNLSADAPTGGRRIRQAA